jgi:acetyl-CoA decarbonylase/synthase complex subunit gamma
MKTSVQNCGCSKNNNLVSITMKDINQNSNQPSASVPANPPAINRNFITGIIQTPAGAIPQIATRLDASDYFGAARVRWGIKRNRYRVDPGLYAIGTPNERSDVLVTANYKLSFDTVRKNLNGLNAWLLVLDTKGVNVWCAAGKGTFGTKELVQRIQTTSLGIIVQHKRLLLPQLGAVGVAAHLVKESSGFTVLYGPVRASDIPSFIQSGYKATKEMRRVNFNFYDRLKLIPTDLRYNLLYYAPLLVLFFLLSGINADGISIRHALSGLLPLVQILTAGYIAGIVFTPLLLPYIPVRSFSFKGYIMGAVVAVFLFFTHSLGSTFVAQVGGFFHISGFSSFLAMNFTGASTFTSLAGVKKEMRFAVPIQIASGVIATILAVLNTLFS